MSARTIGLKYNWQYSEELNINNNQGILTSNKIIRAEQSIRMNSDETVLKI